MLPDDSTGQGPGTLARKLSRCKEGMARVFAVLVQILLSITSVAVQVDGSHKFIPGYKVGGGHWRNVAPALTDRRERNGLQTISEPEIYHGTGF